MQFNLNQCPKGSIYGYAKAFTPLLDQPLEGFVYFRSSNNLLPDIVVDLRGQVTIVLVGRIDSVHKKGSEKSRVRTTFGAVPDAPVTKFVLEMQGGKKGLIVNSVNVCASKRRVKLGFTAQNGRIQNTEPAIAIAGCGK